MIIEDLVPNVQGLVVIPTDFLFDFNEITSHFLEIKKKKKHVSVSLSCSKSSQLPTSKIDRVNLSTSDRTAADSGANSFKNL